MNEEQAEKNPPAILVLTQVIREYREVNDPEGLGRLLFQLEQCLSGEDYEPPKTAAERFTFNRLLVAAERGRESYEKITKRARAGAAATNAARREKAATKPNEKPATVAPVPAKPATVAPVPAKPATVAPVARPRPKQPPRENSERRGGVKSIGDCVNIAAMLGGAGGDISDRINAEPVKTALEIIGETGNKLSENTLKKYLREKGAAAFADTLFAFHSEIKNGEDVDNRGAALFARLSELPNRPA